jgi:cytidine deaminase
MSKNLTPETEKLLWDAAEAAALSYAPFSDFHVGAALPTGEGEIVKRLQCREFFLRTHQPRGVDRGLVCHRGEQIIAGRRDRRVQRDHHTCTPCGACRQVLYESAQHHRAS